MADTNNPEIKKNDATDKGAQASTTNTGDKVGSTATSSNSSNSSAKPSTPITPTPVVKMTTPQTNVEVKYPIEDLIENSKALTDYGKEVAVGALFNCKEKELTKADFKKAIDEFLKRKVK